MTEPEAAATSFKEPFPLDRNQRRVLGVLVEKAFCTSETYPLTANAVITGCNQKSNRDPMTSLPPDVVDSALLSLKQLGLVVQVFPATGRTERWKHNLKEFWQLERPERAVIGELLLRGPQTEGELRGRASRMVAIESLDELARILDGLAARKFVRRLSPPGQKRGVIWTHLLYPPEELSRVTERALEHASSDESDDDESAPATAARPAGGTGPSLSDRVVRLEEGFEAIRAQLAELSALVRGGAEPSDSKPRPTES